MNNTRMKNEAVLKASDVYLAKVVDILKLPENFRYTKESMHTNVGKLTETQKESLISLICESSRVMPNPKWLECVLDVYFDIKVEYMIHIVQ